MHGLGLSTRLQALGLPSEGLLARVIAFNVGVEIGQLLAIAAMLVIGWLARKVITSPKAPRVAHGALVVVGTAAALVLTVLVATGATGTGPQVQATGSCTVRANNEPMRGDGGHPRKDFFEPTEAVPEGDFAHVLGDGFVVVHYPAPLPAAQIDELRAYVISTDGDKVVAAAMPGAEPKLKAFTAYELLSCTEYDLTGLQSFADGWLHDPRSRSPE